LETVGCQAIITIFISEIPLTHTMPIQRKGMRALQIWCSRVTSAYPCVDVTNLTTSFKDGLAFVAIIHHFRPDLIASPNDLDAKDVFKNNELAYRVAEEKLDLAALLDPQDMVDCTEEDGPDKFSIVTYVSQFYHLFKDADDSRMSPNPGLSIRFSESSENDSLISSGSGSEGGTPLGTPTPNRTANRKLVFNHAELIAKYGEEIFSSSDRKSNLGSLCSELEEKARIAAPAAAERS
jgi:hypothetical protein